LRAMRLAALSFCDAVTSRAPIDALAYIAMC
jgi:hypothetical protein